MSHDSAKHKQNGVNYIRSESSNRLVPVALYGQIIEWSQNRLYTMTRSHWVTGPESHYSDTLSYKHKHGCHKSQTASRFIYLTYHSTTNFLKYVTILKKICHYCKLLLLPRQSQNYIKFKYSMSTRIYNIRAINLCCRAVRSFRFLRYE